jgi:hypothetical protein
MGFYGNEVDKIFKTMVAEVNAKLPADRQFSTTFGYPFLFFDV